MIRSPLSFPPFVPGSEDKLSSAASYLATKKELYNRAQRRKVLLRELGSLRWIDSMFSLTQVIHLSCLRRPRAIDRDECVELPAFRANNTRDLSLFDRQPNLLPRADPSCYIDYSAHFSILSIRFFLLLFAVLPFRGPSFLLDAFRRS